MQEFTAGLIQDLRWHRMLVDCRILQYVISANSGLIYPIRCNVGGVRFDCEAY